MWSEINKFLPQFDEAVLSVVGANGYPASFRTDPQADEANNGFVIPTTAAGIDVQPGPASLLFHRHDDNLSSLKSFLLRGTLNRRDDAMWVFTPTKFVPGQGLPGYSDPLSFVIKGRRNTRRYLQKRGWAWPTFDWERNERIMAGEAAAKDDNA